MNRPIKHHYIPKFYLRRWMLDGARLVEFSRPRPGSAEVKPKRVYPGQTGYVNRLYELRGLPPEVPAHSGRSWRGRSSSSRSSSATRRG